jgi:hypothetical protein
MVSPPVVPRSDDKCEFGDLLRQQIYALALIRNDICSDAKRCITHLPLNTQGARHHDTVSTALEILFGKFGGAHAAQPSIMASFKAFLETFPN